MVAPLSRATAASMPVPTSGASARISGTAWRCMFEPISARFASSFSRNGISAAATETSCFGETSIAVTSSGLHQAEIALPAHGDQLLGEAAVAIHRRVGLGDDELLLLHGGEVARLLLHDAVLDQHVRRLDEAVLVDLGEGRERVDQADVRPLRRLDRADAAVMRRVHVAHLEAGALAGQTARSQARTGGACASPPTAGWSGP